MTYDITIKEMEPTDVIGITFDTTPEGIGPESGAAYRRLYDLFGEEEITRLTHLDLSTTA